jgi:ElaA protein
MKTNPKLQYQTLSFYDLTLDQLYALMALRQEVFVVEQNCPYLDADGADQKGWHLLGTSEEGRLLAYARLLPPGVSYPGHASIGRVITSPAARGKGYGLELMRVAIKEINRLFPGAPLKISAQCYLIRFYESLGFKTVGDSYLEDDIPHIAMVFQ